MGEDLMEFGFETSFSLPDVPTRKGLDSSRTYDVLILGAGPAGLSAAIYVIRKNQIPLVRLSTFSYQLPVKAFSFLPFGYRAVMISFLKTSQEGSR